MIFTCYFIFITIIYAGDLPDNFFSESHGLDKPKRTNPFRRKVDGNKTGGDGRGRKVSNEEKKMHMSIESKNKAVSFSLYCETTSNLAGRIRELRKEKRKTISDFADENYDGDKDKVKAKLRLYRHFKEREGDDIDNDSYVESQETMMEELFDLEKDIESTKKITKQHKPRNVKQQMLYLISLTQQM